MTRLRRIAAAALCALSDTVLAGAIVGFGETVRIFAGRAGLDEGALGAGDLPGLLLAVVSLTLAGSLVAGPILIALFRGAGAIPWVAAWRAELGEPGARRVAAVTRGLLALTTAAAFAAGTFAVAAWTHGAFKEPTAIALLEAAILTLFAVVLLVLGSAAIARLPPLVARVEWLHRATTGWRGAAAALAAALGAAAVVLVVIHLAAPAADFRPQLTAVGFVVAIAVLRAARASRRLAPRGRALAAGAGLLAVVIGLATIGAAHHARALVSADGIASRSVLAFLWKLSDRDGDGFPARFGGSDCDDSNPAIHPGARELLGNGIDENCTGGDLTLDAVATRVNPQPSAYPSLAGTRNVLLITIDAMRADHVGAYGYARPTTPRLDELASRSTRFEWVVSPSPTTRRAIPALMTGRYASTLTWQKGENVRVKIRAHEMLGETFKRAAYETVAIHCCTTLFDKPHGVVEGLTRVDATAEKIYRQRKEKYNSDEVAKRVATFLAEKKTQPRPFFLWIHLIDPHDPYVQLPGAPSFGKKPIDKYDSELAYVDAQLGVILDAIEANGLADKTIIAVTADHGDEFDEHGGRFHGRTVYNEVMRVPLVIHDPGAPAGVVSTPVSVIDIGPTLLDLAGIARPAGQNGVSLAAAVREGKPAPDRTVLGELIADYRITRNLVAAYAGTWKIIWDLDANTYELYSLTDDPGDKVDRKHARPDVFLELQRKLHDAVDRELSALPEDPR